MSARLNAIALALVMAATLLLISACGGNGDDEDDAARRPGLDCKARPELCK